jgi:hypothetical protein
LGQGGRRGPQGDDNVTKVLRNLHEGDVRGMNPWQIEATTGIYYALRADVEREKATVEEARETVRRVLDALEARQ